MKETIIISLGGSLIVPNEIDTKFLLEFQSLILRHAKRHKFIIICGGGRTARKYQEAARKTGNPSSIDLDWIGIHATRVNAQLLHALLGKKAYKRIIKNPTERVAFKEQILICAGWKPGFSTDYDAVQLARSHKAKKIINLTNVDYVYTKNPKKFRDARPIKEMAWKYFRKIVGNKWNPGLNAPFDPIASKLAEKYEIKVIIANGKNLGNLEKILHGKEFIGSVIE